MYKKEDAVMKKIRKTKLLGVILCGLITSFTVTSVYKSIDPVFAQDESQSDGRLVFINDGLISLSGRIALCGEGDSVVITVVDSKSNSALPEDSTEVLFMYESKTDKNGNWKFNFVLDKSGSYRAYVGSDGLAETKTIDFKFVDKHKFETASAELISADSADKIAEILKQSAADLGLSEEQIIDFKAISDLVYHEIKEKTKLDIEESEFILKKSNMITELNAGRLDSLKGYEEILTKGSESYKKYLSAAVLDDVSSKLSRRAFYSFKVFDDTIADAALLSAINNGDVKTILNISVDCGNKIGVNGRISESTAEAMTKEKFNSLQDVKNFIASYAETPKSGSSGGSSGGSSFGGKNTYDGKIAEMPDKSTTQQQTASFFDDISELPWATDAITQLAFRGIINGKSDRKFAPLDKITREEFAKIVTVGFKLNLVDVECPFLDVDKNDWAYIYIRSAYIAGIVKGFSDTEFGYGENVTREDLCVMVERAINIGGDKIESDMTEKEIVFDDTDQISEYASESISRLAKAGIISGDGKNFNPKMNATRAEAAKIIYLTLNAIKR